jgi:hypothetical protein
MTIFGLGHNVETKIINNLQRKQEFKSKIFTQKCKKLTPCTKHMKFAYNNNVGISNHQK